MKKITCDLSEAELQMGIVPKDGILLSEAVFCFPKTGKLVLLREFRSGVKETFEISDKEYMDIFKEHLANCNISI